MCLCALIFAVSGIRRRSTASCLVAVLEGLTSAVALYSARAAVVPVIPADAKGLAVQRAMRSGACLAISTPFLMLVARCVILVEGLRDPTVQQPSLGFPVPPGFDEHALLDLYVIGCGVGYLGLVVPALALMGHYLGTMVVGWSIGWPIVWRMVGVALVINCMLLALRACSSVLAPAEGFVLHTRPRRAMWVLCAVGHFTLLAGCFYSPDVDRAIGFVLGLVHILRLLRQAFLYPGTGEDGPLGLVGP